MSSDIETLVESKSKETYHENPGDFPSIGVEIIKKINFKIAIFLFLIGIVIFSDVFIENFLPKNMVDGYCADSKGTLIQLLIFVLLYLLIDLFVQGGIL